MKKLIIAAYCLVAFFLIQVESYARPVSYPGGWTIMQNNNFDSHSVHVHYSPTAKYSIGYKGEYWRDEDWQFHGAQLNYLVKRWNKPASQANFYIKSGAGVAYSDYKQFDSKTEPAAFTGIAVDWEDRRYFTSYHNHLLYAGDIEKHYTQSAKVGIAPYIGDYGDIHTWMMFQADHNPKGNDEFVFTPHLRFFKSEYLAEIGMSDDGDVLFNWIVRF
jgi:hypothetical protein